MKISLVGVRVLILINSILVKIRVRILMKISIVDRMLLLVRIVLIRVEIVMILPIPPREKKEHTRGGGR